MSIGVAVCETSSGRQYRREFLLSVTERVSGSTRFQYVWWQLGSLIDPQPEPAHGAAADFALHTIREKSSADAGYESASSPRVGEALARLSEAGFGHA